MTNPDFGVGYIPDVEQQDGVLLAHRLYHSQSQTESQAAHVAQAIGKVLSVSPEWDHKIDSGWSAVQAVLSGYPNAEESFNLAEQAWKATIEGSGKLWVHAQAAKSMAYLPTFRESLLSGRLDMPGLFERLLRVNTELITAGPECGRRIAGQAVELAVLLLLVRHAVMTDDETMLSWPSLPWQDGHEPENKAENFDIGVGWFPTLRHKIEVKSCFKQSKVIKELDNSSDEVIDFYWQQQYHSDITLIFGDKHLGIPKGCCLYANYLLSASVSDERSHELDHMTQNILKEIQ